MSAVVERASAPFEGLRLRTASAGEGPAVVLVHGWGADLIANWERPGWIEALLPWFHVVALDLPGHGDSDKPHEAGRYGYAALGRAVIAVLDHLGIERAALVGHSLGAFSGAWTVGHHAERLWGAVLMGVGDETPESVAVAQDIAAALRAPDGRALSNPTGRLYRRFVDADPRNDREALALAALEMWPQGFPVELGAPFCDPSPPVLVLNGSEDEPYAATADRLVAAIPGAHGEIVEGADHLGPIHDGRFLESAIRFLRDADERREHA